MCVPVTFFSNSLLYYLQIEFIEKEKSDKKGSVESQVLYMFKLWVENEGEEANKDSLLYTLGGLKMTSVADGVFT